jgi:tetratricopeptide (TPR) repeat protein
MQLEIPLGQPGRLFLSVLASVLCLALVYFAATRFVVRSLTTPAITLRRGEIETSARYFPDASGIQALLAYSDLADDSDYEAAAARAENSALRAARLNPKKFDYRLLVAQAREMKGDRAGAEIALHEALALAPNRVETAWRLANALVREGKVDESLPYFARAMDARHALIPQALALLWEVTNGDVGKLRTAVGKSLKPQIDLAFFLVQREKITEGVEVFNDIDRAERLRTPDGGAFVTGLINSGQLELARRIWVQMVTDRPEEVNALIFNGGFESAINPSLDQFDWMISENAHFAPYIAAGTAHSGSKSLRLDFKGINTTRIDGEIRQLLMVKPGGRYRLTCFVKTNGLATPEGPRIMVTHPDRVSQIAASEPIAAGTADWKQIEVVFTVPQSQAVILVQVKRIPKFSYDDPTKGTIWLDDFVLSEM